METRKVQVTGGSTYTVSLPKTWATDVGVEAGSEVTFYPDGDSLFLTPTTDDQQTRGRLDVTDLTDEALTRGVMTMYVSGFDVIVLGSPGLATEQRGTIRSAVQSLVGLEIVEENSEQVVVQDLLDSAELSIHNAVTRMRLIALSMLDDALTALEERDDTLAADVIDRDDDVDRLWMVVSRIFRSTLRTPRAAAELGLPRETCFDYHSSARQLERIADHATKIAHLTRNIDEPIPGQVVDAIDELHESAVDVIDTALDSLFQDDTEAATQMANEARGQVLEMDNRVREIDDLLRELNPAQAQLLGLVVDSVLRSGDYGGNIAETALQKTAPSP
jgi:Phosphate uptake regulator